MVNHILCTRMIRRKLWFFRAITCASEGNEILLFSSKLLVFLQILRMKGFVALLVLVQICGCTAFSLCSFLAKTTSASSVAVNSKLTGIRCPSNTHLHRKQGTHLPLRSSADYILDTFDPEEEEDELSNEVMLR
jgi:hypothetical protein